MTQIAASPEHITPPWWNTYQRARFLLTCASLLAFLIVYAMARFVGFPHEAGYSVSIFQQPSPVLDLLAILVAYVLALLVGTSIAGGIRFEAGLVAACFGLVALTVRGGNITATLHAAKSGGVYLTLAVELVVLYAIVAAGWGILVALERRKLLLPNHLRDGVEQRDDTLGTKLMATAAQVIAMMAILYVLAQTDDKKQVLCAVFIASMAATAIAHSAFPIEPSFYFWIGPLAVGLIGYGYGAASPGPWMIGRPANPLAAPLPIDYAALGPAGAIMGYWMSRRWLRAKQTQITPDGGPIMTDAHMPMG